MLWSVLTGRLKNVIAGQPPTNDGKRVRNVVLSRYSEDDHPPMPGEYEQLGLFDHIKLPGPGSPEEQTYRSTYLRNTGISSTMGSPTDQEPASLDTNSSRRHRKQLKSPQSENSQKLLFEE
jgi:hypothetical protein